MRRLFPTLIVLFIAGAAVFLIGWVQLKLPAGRYGVIVSKTSGVSDMVLAPGKFRWSPVFLLPTNARVFSFSLSLVTRESEVKGELPSGASYAALLEGKPDFSYLVRCAIVVAPEPGGLPDIVRMRGVESQASLDSWTAMRADAALSAMRALVGEAAGSGLEGLSGLASLGDRCAALLGDRFPELSVHSVDVTPIRLPDAALYERARKLYGSFSDSYAASLAPVLEEEAVRGAKDSVRLETLEKYGKLLERYPILVQYLAVEKGLPPAPSAWAVQGAAAPAAAAGVPAPVGAGK